MPSLESKDAAHRNHLTLQYYSKLKFLTVIPFRDAPIQSLQVALTDFIDIIWYLTD